MSLVIHEYKDTKISHVFTTLWIDKYWRSDVYLSLIDLFLLGLDSTEFCQNLTGSTAKVLRIELVENSHNCLGYSKLLYFICHNITNQNQQQKGLPNQIQSLVAFPGRPIISSV